MVKYEFYGVVDVGDGINGCDVERMVAEGFKADRDTQLLTVRADARRYIKPTLTHYALDREVLAVAVPGEVGDWAVYVGAVPGRNHGDEIQGVASEGSKLPLHLAKILFPQFDPEKYRR
jgi:hypothetical protein